MKKVRSLSKEKIDEISALIGADALQLVFYMLYYRRISLKQAAA